MNNVVNSSAAITKLCPELMAYFASGTRRLEVRPQAAARDCPVQARIRPGARGHLRLRAQVRRERRGFSRPSRTAARQTNSGSGVDGALMLALPYRDDIDLPEGNSAYAVFRERNTPSLTASDLFS